MSELKTQQCEPCQGWVPPLSPQRVHTLLGQLVGWEVVYGHHLSKSLTFPDFVEALAKVNSIGALAEEQGHHPDLYLTWGKVRVDIWTHKIDGLTESDFILAAKIDAL